MNEELRRFFKEDQDDRKMSNRSELRARDRARRLRVEQLIHEGAVQTPEDYFHAALIFQHGEVLDHYWKAHELARVAAAGGFSGARWLAAAAYDRWLMSQGRPQKYGTQYIRDESGSRTLWNIDPTTTDEERAEWEVPPLEELLRRAKEGFSFPSQRPPRLASLQIPDLEVEIIAFDERYVRMRLSDEQIALEKVEIPSPPGFPPELKLYQTREEYCAMTPDGQMAIHWRKASIPIHRSFVYVWKEASPPELAVVRSDSQVAIIIKATDASSTRLVFRTSALHCWLVWGQYSPQELLHIAMLHPEIAQYKS